MGIEYAAQKMAMTVGGMATSTADLQTRIWHAFLTFHPIRRQDDLPTPELRERYDRLLEQLTADRSDQDQGYVPTTIASMVDKDAKRIAEDIVSFAGLCQLVHEDEIRQGRTR